jgi:hypothetical protein
MPNQHRLLGLSTANISNPQIDQPHQNHQNGQNRRTQRPLRARGAKPHFRRRRVSLRTSTSYTPSTPPKTFSQPLTAQATQRPHPPMQTLHTGLPQIPSPTRRNPPADLGSSYGPSSPRTPSLRKALQRPHDLPLQRFTHTVHLPRLS